MPVISFPSAPSVNDTYSFNGKTWIYTGQAWNLATSGSINDIPIGNVTPATGNFTTVGATGNITSSANISASYFLGNGSQLTGIIAGGTLTVSNVAPISPSAGDVWIAANTGVQFVYFTSGGNSQWAEMESDTSISITSTSGANIDLTAVASNIIPSANITYDIGNTSNRFRDIYLANSTIYLGNAAISANGSNIVMTSAVIASATVGNMTNDSTGFMSLPVGNTAQRPMSATAGMTRYNTTTGYPEFYDGNNWYNFYQQKIYNVSYLVVAGGGGGGSGAGGGGGAGGLRTGDGLSVDVGTIYTVTIGAGGTGGPPGSLNGGGTGRGSNGASSVFGSITSAGGGAGGGWDQSALAGGSGGGGGGRGSQAGGAGNTPPVSPSQGSAGGTSNSSTSPGVNGHGAGGGGAGAVGSSGDGSAAGGSGTSSSISGSSVTYAGGGGGGGFGPAPGGAGGTGGGGAGGTAGGSNGIDGTVNTGGGGGGSQASQSSPHPSPQGLSGGSGIVIISYAGSQKGTGGTVTSAGGNTIHTFTSSGTYTA